MNEIGDTSFEPQVLRLPIGPSPWDCYDRSLVFRETTYHFRQPIDHQGRRMALMTSLHDSNGATLLILNDHCRMKILDDGTVLLWRPRRWDRPIRFECFHFSSLRRIDDAATTAREVRKEKLDVSPLAISEHWEFSTSLEAGVHSLTIPYDWSRFEETLAVASNRPRIRPGKDANAIFAFDWHKRQVDVFPQDWYDEVGYDTLHEGIFAIARRTDGSIIGDVNRNESFELDETNRRVKQWLPRRTLSGPRRPRPPQDGEDR